MSAADIEFVGVTKAYGNVLAVRELSFTAARGTLTTLLGPSGCGKTTVLRLIAGLELPTSGFIRIGGREVSHVPASERDVGMVFQSYALFPHMSVHENVRYGLDVANVGRATAAARVDATLEQVGLAGFGDRLPSQLSGGQQQRVALARALVLEPAVLLFDEPLSNLDARLRRQMRDEIRELQRRLSLTVVYVTHDQAEAMAVSDRVIVMNLGQIAQAGSPRELYDAPHDAFVAAFMGDANLLRGTLARRDARYGTLTLGPLTLDVAHRGLPDGDVMVSIRPEALAVSDDPAIPLPGTVKQSAFVGAAVEYVLDTPLGELFAVCADNGVVHAPGTAVRVSIAPRGAALLPSAPG